MLLSVTIEHNAQSQYEKSSLTVVPNAHGMIEGPLRQYLLRKFVNLLREIGVRRFRVRDGELSLLILVHVCKALLEAARH